MRKLASIQRIHNIRSIEGADNICVGSILGWNVVVEKNKFKENELVIFFEIDSFLPIRQEYAFLQNRGIKKMIINQEEHIGYRLKTIRLRGQISQGLALPLFILKSTVPEGTAYVMSDDALLGQDVTDLLGVYKYEIPLPTQLAGKVRGNFPGFLPKTDEPRLQAFPQLLERYKDKPFFVTEKLDGSSVTFVIKNGEFHACSRGMDWLDDGSNTIWRVAKEMKIEEKMRLLKEERYAIQGELVGEKIQNNTLMLSNHQVFFFSVYDFIDGKYLDYSQYKMITAMLGLPIVPILQTDMALPKTVDEAVKFATRKSVINPKGWAEGVVFRPMEEVQDDLLGTHLSFKVVNPEFLLKNE